jgi:SAM-dependent methyltransferase
MESSYIINIEGGAETARLALQDHLSTRMMGGVFPKDLGLHAIKDVLDLGCGPGGWALEVAFQHPAMQVIGIDLSRTMTEYATAQARVQHLTNVFFEIMDIRNPLPFGDACFDLVNLRLLMAVIAPRRWPNLLAECRRILRPGGKIWWSEPEPVGASNSPAYERLIALVMLAVSLQMEGVPPPTWPHLGLAPQMGKLLREAGFKIVSKTGYLHESSFGTEGNEFAVQNAVVEFELVKKHLIGHKLIPQDQYELLQKQMVAEFSEPGFCGVLCLHSWLAEKPLAS